MACMTSGSRSISPFSVLDPTLVSFSPLLNSAVQVSLNVDPATAKSVHQQTPLTPLNVQKTTFQLLKVDVEPFFVHSYRLA